MFLSVTTQSFSESQPGAEVLTMEPFTEKEQRFVLAEIIKTSQVNVHSLVDFIKSQNVDADWRNMQIPHGQPSASG